MYVICEAFYTATKVWITLHLFNIKQTQPNSPLHKFNTFCIVLNLWLALDLYGLFVMSLFTVFLREFNINPDTLTDRNKYHCICILFCIVILIWLEQKLHCSLYIRRFFNRQRANLVFPIVILLALCVIYFHKVYERLIAERIVLSWLMFFFIVAIFFVYRAVQRENTRDKMLQMRFKMLEDNYKTLLNAQKEKSTLLHDMKHHMATLQAIIETENQQEALNYIQQIYNKLIKRQNHTWTYNSVLDLVLNGKLEEAQQENIQVKIECDNMSELALKPMDICALFSNILDNAIEANTRQTQEKKRWISLSCKRHKCIMVIVLKNPVDKKLNSKDGIPQTVKDDKENHGYGMYSVQKIVSNYDGYMNFRTEDGIFILAIGLNGFLKDDKPMMARK